MVDELRDGIESSVSMGGGIHHQLRPRRGVRLNGGHRVDGRALVMVTEISGVGDGRESWAMISGWCRVKD